MWRRPEVWLGLALVGALIFAAVTGGGARTNNPWADYRTSTANSGPRGAKALAAVLRRLGVEVRERRRPLFDLTRDRTASPRGEELAFLGIAKPTAPELVAVRNYVARGGRVFVAGPTGVESCFGYNSRPVASTDLESDSVVVRRTTYGAMPGAYRVMLPVETESSKTEAGQALGCPVLFPRSIDTLLTAADGRAVALDLRFASGGRAVLLADARFVTNWALKRTSAGVPVVAWLLAGRPRLVVFDEYHLGRGSAGSLWGAAWEWLWAGPLGWFILQLIAVALVALAAQAVRFGPARPGIERRRRSPLEHLEALATGLQEAAGEATAIRLVVAGLWRRLSRTGIVGRAGGERLDALALAVSTERGRAAVRRLEDIATAPAGGERVLAAAQSVEDVWEELRPRTTRGGY